MSIANLLDTFKVILLKFEATQIPYMIVGSLSSIVYGEPRMTNDMDIVLDIHVEDAERIETLFPLEGYYCPPIEVLKAEIVARGQFNLLDHDSGLKIDIVVRKQSPHSIEEFRRRKKMAFSKNFSAYIASPEDIIIKKLEFYRLGGSEKHIGDIRGILANTSIDKEYLDSWIQKLSLQSAWSKIDA